MRERPGSRQVSDGHPPGAVGGGRRGEPAREGTISFAGGPLEGKRIPALRGSAAPNVRAAGVESRRDAVQQSLPPTPALAGLVPGPPRALGRAADGAARPAAEGGEGGCRAAPVAGWGGRDAVPSITPSPREELSSPGEEPCDGSRSPPGAPSDVTKTQLSFVTSEEMLLHLYPLLWWMCSLEYVHQ